MLRKFFVFVILTLILSTTFIKNHTKKLDEEIFSIRESMNYLNNVKELVQLEYEYLSSPDKLLKLMDLYLENDLEITSVENIKIISEIDQINSTNFNINE
tara:strand:+ start:173 stop:472 length:300 start_codon:yes stop_codon:yes gene_type:complete